MLRKIEMTQSCIMMQALYKNTWNSVCTSDKFSLSHFFYVRHFEQRLFGLQRCFQPGFKTPKSFAITLVPHFLFIWLFNATFGPLHMLSQLHLNPWVILHIQQGRPQGKYIFPFVWTQIYKLDRVAHIPVVAWKLILPQQYIFDLISIVNYVPAAIFMVFWIYLLHFFSMFLCNHITLQGSNHLRGDWKILWGEITLLRDDFQVLFCHHHELNILF